MRWHGRDYKNLTWEWGAGRKFRPEAVTSDAKQLKRGMEFSIRTEQSCLILFLAYRSVSNFYFKSNIHYHSQWRSRTGHFLICHNAIKLATTLRDVLYNQCKPNSRKKFLFYPTHGWDNMGERNFYPKRKPRISLSGMQKKDFLSQSKTSDYLIWYAKKIVLTGLCSIAL